MNLKVRFRNPVFIAQLILAIITPVGAYFGLTGADMTTWAKVWKTAAAAIGNPYVVVLAIISMWNALNDPTTAGVGDSNRAMSYTVPKKD